MNKKGFVLVETLVVVIFVLLIFTILYESAVPLLGRYTELSYYDDLDATYDLYYLKKLVTRDINYSTLLSLDSGYSVLNCTNDTIYSYEDCNSLFNALNLSSKDRLVYINMKDLNKNISKINSDSEITDAMKDYVNFIQTDSRILLLEHNGYLSYIELGNSISVDSYTPVSVNFNANGGSVSPTSKQVAGIYGTLPTPTKSGYEFAGWTVSDSDAEYQELEYIESTGTQYVDTNYRVTSSTNIEMVFEYLGTDTTATWVVLSGVRGSGGATSSAAFGFWIHRSSLKLGVEYAGYDPGTSSNLPIIKEEEKHAFKNNVGNFYIDNDSSHNAYTSNVFNNSNGTNNIYIFALNNNGTLDSRECHMRLYSYKIYNNNQLVKDFVPVKKVSNNEVGLLDVKNNTFYKNNGTDVFLPGPAKDIITSSSRVLKNTTHTLKANWRSPNTIPYSITNLITNGSFEDDTTGWTLSNTGVVSGGSNGSKSLRFNNNGSNTTMSTQFLSQSAPIINHKYYGSLMFKSSSTFTTSDSRFEWRYNDDTAKGTMIFARKQMQVSNWTKISDIKSITDSEYLSNTWTVRNFHVNANGYSYVDSLMIIDLTASFGAGNEPNKAWCDANINYFNGTTIVYK